MKFNSLATALAQAQKEKPLVTVPSTPVPKPVELPPVPSFPPLKRVEGGVINRVPVNKQAALLVAKPPWWAYSPYVPEKQEGKSLPEIQAQLNRAADWIKQLEKINHKLRDQLKKQAEAGAADQQAHEAALAALHAENKQLKAELAAVKEQLKIASIWTPNR